MDASVLASVVSAGVFVVTFVSTLTFGANDGVVSDRSPVVVFVVSTTSLSNVRCALVVSFGSIVKFSVASIVFTGETVPAVSFSLRVVVEVSSSTVMVVDLMVFGTSTFVLTAVTGSAESTSVSLADVIT